MIYGEGGGCTLDVAGAATLACLPLRGSVQVRTNGLTRGVETGEVLVTDHEARTILIGHGTGRWLALLGSRQAWSLALPHIAASGGQLLPDMHKADHATRRQAIAVVRAAHTASLEGTVNALADRLAELQTRLHQAVARCPGRTWAAKRQVFLRLQRVCNYVDACCDRELDLDELARMANYSPCHFLRTFRMAYLTTPHAYVTDQRLRRAWKLLRSGHLAVTEVAIASGFENRSAFSRLFRERFGTTAQDAKRQRDGVIAVPGSSVPSRNRAIPATY